MLNSLLENIKISMENVHVIIPLSLWPFAKLVLKYEKENSFTSGSYVDPIFAARVLDFCFLNHLLILPGNWQLRDMFLNSFSFCEILVSVLNISLDKYISSSFNEVISFSVRFILLFVKCLQLIFYK